MEVCITIHVDIIGEYFFNNLKIGLIVFVSTIKPVVKKKHISATFIIVCTFRIMSKIGIECC